MKTVITIVRLLLGSMLVIFGLNGFFQFIPMPTPSEEMGAFMGALFVTGYLFPFIAIIEIGTGILFLTNRLTSLAAILVFPVLLNAFLAHLFLDVPGIAAAAIVIHMNLFLFYAYRNQYRTLFIWNQKSKK